ncbi:MAG TPA: BrnA antitoxin family protein [Blastocatellia bacterium]|nr:BrnA antitoxin family protein [Blastocatellia bacterium]
MKKEYNFSRGKRGAVIASAPGKTCITIRPDDEVLAWFRKQAHEAGGGNYQTLINEALREYISQRPETLEKVMRRIVREEIRRAVSKPAGKKVA